MLSSDSQEGVFTLCAAPWAIQCMRGFPFGAYIVPVPPLSEGTGGRGPGQRTGAPGSRP